MRVLVNVVGADGHFLPMVPLARGLEAAGHDVVFAIDRSYVSVVDARGFKSLPLDPPKDMSSDEVVAESIARVGLDRFRYQIGGFLEVAVTNATRIVDLVEHHRPDVLVRETTGWAGWLAGELLDVPVAMFDFSPTPAGFFRETLGDLFDEARRAVGLPSDPDLASLDKWLTLIGAPPGWFPPECFHPTTHLLQPPEDPLDGGSLPAWFDCLPDRPTVYVTLGTVFNNTPGAFDAVLTAVADLDANVIVTVGRSTDPDAYAVPEHVRVERFIPQALLLPHCDAVIAHGGYGSLMGALRQGIPVVALPLAAGDNELNARRVEKLGAGIAIRENHRSPAAILTAAVAILTEPSYRQAAQRVAAGLASLPTFLHAVPLVERLAHGRQPVLRENPA